MVSEIVAAFADYKKRADHGDVFQGTVWEQTLHALLIKHPTEITLAEDFRKILRDNKISWEELRRADPWFDMQAANEVFEKTLAIAEAFTPKGLIAEEIKDEWVKLVKEKQAETERRLDYVRASPMRSSFEERAVGLHKMVNTIIEACYAVSITVGEGTSYDTSNLVKQLFAEKEAET